MNSLMYDIQIILLYGIRNTIVIDHIDWHELRNERSKRSEKRSDIEY